MISVPYCNSSTNWCSLMLSELMNKLRSEPLRGVTGISKFSLFQESRDSVLFAFIHTICYNMGFPGGSVGTESACLVGVAGDMSSIPGSERSPGRGHGNPPQHSCLENPMDRRAWQATVHRIAESQTQLKQLSTYAY